MPPPANGSSHERPPRAELKRVCRAFHRAARAVRIPRRERWRYWWFYLRLARKGTMVHSSTRDAVYEDSKWKRGYDRSCEAINARLERAGLATNVEIPTFEHGQLELDDLHLLMKRQVPFLIRNGVEALPMARWDLDYLEQVAGDCDVPINEADDRPSTDVSRPTKASEYYQFRTGPLREVIAGIREGRYVRTTTAENVMHHGGEQLRRDLDLPYWEQVSGWADNKNHWLRGRLMVGRIVGAQMLLQPENAFTLWHAEPGDNFFVLAQGVKNWSLIHPYYTAAMRPRVKSTTNYHGSTIDIREDDDVLRERGFNGYLSVPKVSFQMQPGDMLRIPNHWWHTVVTQPGSYTAGVSIRSIGSANLTCMGYTFLRNLDEQYHAMARTFVEDGRIHDGLIGYPRKSRTGKQESA